MQDCEICFDERQCVEISYIFRDFEPFKRELRAYVTDSLAFLSQRPVSISGKNSTAKDTGWRGN